jgi:DNA-binding SARP family transcriptional activator
VLFRLLGEVCVVDDDGRTSAIVAPRQRALLAMLVLRANRVVSASAAIEGVWGEDLPDHPTAALHVVMSRLRRAIGSAADCIRSEGGGYRLDVGPDEVDVTRVEGLLRTGRTALAEHDPRRAAVSLDAALAYWSGEALEGLADFPFYAAGVQRLSELHWTVYEARCDAYLTAGRHLEVLADIGDWIAANPLGEHVRALQVAALYRSGRQVDALAACADLRERLREQLGIEPSRSFQDLERKVLDHDPDMLATDAGLTVPMPAWTNETLSFVGREQELEVASNSLRSAVRDGFRMLVVEGEPGSGKSRLLLELARRFGRDTIVVPVDVHESMYSSVVALVHSLAAAARRLSHDELDALLRVVPDFAEVLGASLPPQEALMGRSAGWLAALSAKAPVVVLIDDIDGANPTLLHVIGQLLDAAVKRSLVVVSTGGQIARSAGSFQRLVTEFERRGMVDTIALGPLSDDDIRQLVDRLGIEPGRRQRVAYEQLVDLTSGSPFLLAELLSTGQPERLGDEWAVPPRVRDVVLARLDALGRATGEALQAASVFEREFTVPLLSEILELPASATTTIISRAVDAQMLHSGGLHTYRFAHQLARRTIAESLDPAERAAAHRRAAMAIERAGTASAADLAFHWSQADGPDASNKTIEYARQAGDEAKRLLEPANAAQWYEIALSLVDEGEARGALLVALAEAQYLAGDPEFARTLRGAASDAVERGDPEMLVRVATLSSPAWTMLPGLVDGDVLALLERALELAPDDAGRSKVLVRLATERALRDPLDAEVLSLEAITLARRSGSPEALVDALIRHSSMAQAPSSATRRRAEVDEALQLAETLHDDFARYYLAGAGMIAALQVADMAGCEQYIAVADAISRRNSLPPLVWTQRARRAWRFGLAGRLDDAERLIRIARDYGLANGMPHAEYVGLLQLAQLRWHQRRTSSIVSRVRDADAFFERFPGLNHVLIRALAVDEANRPDARRRLRALAANKFEDMPQNTFWATLLVLSAESAWILEMPDVAEMLRPMFDSCVDQVAFNGMWVAAPLAHGAAFASAALGAADADDLFELAIDVADRLDSPFLRARSQLSWAATTVRGETARPDHANALCLEVIETARTLDLVDLEKRAAELQVQTHP